MITKRGFGRLPSGAETTLYTLTNASGASASVIDYGGILQSVRVPDKRGALADVVLGYDDVSGYIPTCGYLGALIGRVGNRIGNAEFVLNGDWYKLCKNDGANHLHGGKSGFNEKIWRAETEGDQLVLSIVSPDGEEGYPGNLSVKVTYAFSEENALSIHYEATSDRDTLCNLTNHAYFNLAGGGTILNHELTLDCDKLTVVRAGCIPTGELRDVTGTPFDFREGRVVGRDIDADDEQLRLGKGYDHNFVINGSGLRRCARLACAGRVMEAYTDLPGVQFYAGNMLESVHPGKGGARYHKREGLCLETQFHPDSINHPAFPDSVLRKGQKYDHTTIYAFKAE